MTRPSRQAALLAQCGVALFLFTSAWGFIIPMLGSQRVGLSVHTLSGFQGVLLLMLGLIWPRLEFGRRTSWIAFACALHGASAILAAYIIAAIWGVGSNTLRLVGELPHGLRAGTALQEAVIAGLAYSSAPTGIASYLLILWGLRHGGASERKSSPSPWGEYSSKGEGSG
jgi:hydroxylaminobenzene mutase